MAREVRPLESSDKDTLRELILGELQEHGRRCDCELMEALVFMHRRAGMDYRWDTYENAIHSLVCGRRIEQAPGKWEGEYFYELRKRPSPKRQKVLF